MCESDKQFKLLGRRRLRTIATTSWNVGMVRNRRESGKVSNNRRERTKYRKLREDKQAARACTEKKRGLRRGWKNYAKKVRNFENKNMITGSNYLTAVESSSIFWFRLRWVAHHESGGAQMRLTELKGRKIVLRSYVVHIFLHWIKIKFLGGGFFAQVLLVPLDTETSSILRESVQ